MLKLSDALRLWLMCAKGSRLYFFIICGDKITEITGQFGNFSSKYVVCHTSRFIFFIVIGNMKCLEKIEEMKKKLVKKHKYIEGFVSEREECFGK